MATETAAQPTDEVQYDDAIVRKFILASILFGAVGLLVGVIMIARRRVRLRLEWADFRLDPPRLAQIARIGALVGAAAREITEQSGGMLR